MSSITRRSLRVYSSIANLKSNKEEDILDALIPFLEPILGVMSGKVFDPSLLAAGVRRLYRWRFTRDIAEQFIPRFVGKNYLQRTGSGSSSAYIVTYEPKQEEGPLIGKALNLIIDQFEKFPPKITDLLNYARTRDELTDILVRFLVSIDAYREGRFSGLANLSLEKESEDLFQRLEEGDSALSDDDKYMCARFVKHLAKYSPELVPHLTKLASIGLLTEVVEDFVKPVTAATKTDLTIVIDAPLALDYLGCSGKDLLNDVKSIFDSIKSIGGSLIVFPVTCEEISRNLKSMMSLPSHRRHGYTHEAMSRGEVMAEYVTSVANNPEQALKAVGITVRPIDRSSIPSMHTYFDENRYEDFFSAVHWVQDVRPREHDATCMALVMRLRHGKSSSDLFQNKYILVTRNPTFARESRAYCVQSRLISERQEGPVIHQRELATIAWLRTGLGGDEKIPRGHLLGTCELVLKVRPELTAAVGEKLRQVSPDNINQFELLLLDSRSVRRLADQTLNDESVVTAENAGQLLEVMKAAAIEEERVVFEQQMAAQKEKHAAERKAISSQRSLALGERDAAQALLAERTIADQKRFEILIKQQNHFIRILELTVIGSLLLLGAAGVVQYFTQYFSGSAVWYCITTVSGALGLYYFYTNLLEKPKIGLASILSAVSRFLFFRKLSTHGLQNFVGMDQVQIKNGQIRLL